MKPFKRLYLDTNVVIALWEGNDDKISGLLTDMLCAPSAGSERMFCTSDLTLAETLVRPLKLQQMDLVRRYESFLQTSDFLETIPAERQVLYFAAVIRSQFRLKLPDAIHLSSAFAMGCSHILTNDTDFEDEYVLRHSRDGMTAPPLSISVLRPDEKTLKALIQNIEHE